MVTGWSTAIFRERLSRPARWLVEKGFLKDAKQGLDYGCGRGVDAGLLGFEKFDPHWFPSQPPTGIFDVVLCTYVLNIVPESEEADILKSLRYCLADEGRAFVSVRRDIKADKPGRGCVQRSVELSSASLVKNSSFEIYMFEKQ